MFPTLRQRRDNIGNIIPCAVVNRKFKADANHGKRMKAVEVSLQMQFYYMTLLF